MMKILIVGSGGREHAIAWKFKQSQVQHELFCANGNAGIAEIANCVNIKADEIIELADCRSRKN
jgi:phosphoribosylamine---glycine ligase